MSMADLIQWGRTSQRTGLFKFDDERGKEIRVVLSDGRIVFSSTNDKRERWRNYLLYHGFCSEEDIEAAFRVQAATGAAAAAVLVQEKKITQEQALSTLTEKTIEDVCDVFLWSEGKFEFEPTKAALKSSMTINVDPIHVVGRARDEVWNRITRSSTRPATSNRATRPSTTGNGKTCSWPGTSSRRSTRTSTSPS